MRKIVNRIIVGDTITTIYSPQSTKSFWSEQLHYDDGSSAVVPREKITFNASRDRITMVMIEMGKSIKDRLN